MLHSINLQTILYKRLRVKGGMGFFLSIGTGLGIGLFAGPGWGWQAIIGGILITTAQIVFRSDTFEAYVANCRARSVNPSGMVYFGLSLARNLFLIFVVAFVIFFVRGFVEQVLG